MKNFWRILALLAGLALFGWYLSRADLRSVGESLARLGWLAPLVLVPYLFVYGADCLGWKFSFPPETKVSFWTLFRIRWAGEAVNNVVPSAYVGGEAVKVYLLRKHGVPAGPGTSAAVVSKTAQTLAQVLTIVLASIAFLQIAGDKPGLRTGMSLVLIAGLAVMAGLFWIQRRGIFGTALSVAKVLRLKLAFLDQRREKILGVDQAIIGFYRHHRPRFYASTGFYLAGWLIDTLEIYLVAHLLGMPITWSQALAVEAFIGVAKVLGMWVPGSLGIQESGIIMLCRLAGLPDTLGVAYAILRRAREVIFAIIGWLLLYADNASLRAIKAAPPSDISS
jgi:glycosyltransferase 2 family protein